MKKLIGIVIASMMFANIGYAEMRLIEEKKIESKEFTYFFSTFCVDGYKFVVTKFNQQRSMVQFFEKKGEVASVPAKC